MRGDPYSNAVGLSGIGSPWRACERTKDLATDSGDFVVALRRGAGRL